MSGVEVVTEVGYCLSAYHSVMNSHLMHLHHLLVGAVCALALVGCAGTQTIPPMNHDGTYYHFDDDTQGLWETSGSDRTNGRPCTWSRSTGVPLSIDNTIALGRSNSTARVTVRAGEYFVFHGCHDWHHVA